jgi:hypothetical protein
LALRSAGRSKSLGASKYLVHNAFADSECFPFPDLAIERVDALSKYRPSPREQSWTSRSAQILAFLGGGMLLVVGLAFLDAIHPLSLFASTLASQSAPAASGASQNRKQVAKAGGGADAGDLNESRLDAVRKDLESRIDADRKDAAERINEKLEGDKDLLGALIGLTGIASLIIGFVSFMSVKYARDEAKDQVEIFRKKIEEIERTFPEFGGLDERIRGRLREVELRMPSEADWNDDQSFRALSESEKQGILDDEIAIAASVSVFALDRSPVLRARLVSIYSAFARFYVARHNAAADVSEGDYVRALSYASRAIQLAPEAVGGYRLRGAIYIARYDRGATANPPEDAGKLKVFLDLAKADLEVAVVQREPVDAGAFFNLALVHHYKGHTGEAVKTSRRLISLKSKISAMQREKYLPDTYRNLACFLAILAQKAGSQKQAQTAQLSAEAVQAVQEGIKEFEPTIKQDGGLAALKKAIEGELKPGQDLERLEKPFREEIAALIAANPAATAPAPTPVPGLKNP